MPAAARVRTGILSWGARARIDLGRRIARLLAGSWRLEPRPAPNEPLEAMIPFLIRSGTAGLGWWRVRLQDGSPVAEILRQSFQRQQQAVGPHEQRLARAIARLRAAGIEPFTAKGWAAGRLYPIPGMRACGDIDLYVRPDAFTEAAAALGASAGDVDLHRGCPELDDRAWSDLERRSQTLSLGTMHARAFGPEDHLRLVALHMMRHGAWRPLWLCDVAVALEAAHGRLDWDRLLSGQPHRTAWLVCALRLAQELLDADLGGAPPQAWRAPLPRWLVSAALRQWGSPSFVPHGRRRPMKSCLLHPTALPRAFWIRWPNPIEASFDLGAPLDDRPRLPYQLTECFIRAGRFARGLVARGAA